MQITGSEGNGAVKVTTKQELKTEASTEAKLATAIAEGNAYSWDSTEKDIDVGDTMLFVKNTSTSNLIIDFAVINGSNVICTWDIGIGTATTTPSGTAVTGVNQNTDYASSSASVTALSDETAVADASVIRRVKTPVTNTVIVDLGGVEIGTNHYIQVNQETESTSGSVILVWHYE